MHDIKLQGGVISIGLRDEICVRSRPRYIALKLIMIPSPSNSLDAELSSR